MPEQPILAFPTAAKFRQWLKRHHADHLGLWLKIAKKGSGIATVTYAEAVDEALCFGWIDGQRKAADETTFSRGSRRAALAASGRKSTSVMWRACKRPAA